MKSIMTAILWIILCASPVCAEPSVWTIPQHVNIVARQVHVHISDKAHEGLFEAKRLRDGWLYTYQVGYGKSWTEEVRIKLESVSAKETRIQVEAYRIEKGVLFDGKRVDHQLQNITVLWMKEITF